MKKISVLGTDYKIIIKKYDEEKSFKRLSIAGFCDIHAKEIVVCDMSTYEGYDCVDEETIIAEQKSMLKHEIVHAFLYESGLSDNSAKYADGWATNEEMVDWFARQGSKIYAAWKDAGALKEVNHEEAI